MNKEQIYKASIRLWGEPSQVLMAIEEMSELIKELTKWINKRTNIKDKILEEMADVEIMLEQLRVIFDCDSYINEVKILKLQRLAELIVKAEKK